jgi:hypothetical protein
MAATAPSGSTPLAIASAVDSLYEWSAAATLLASDISLSSNRTKFFSWDVLSISKRQQVAGPPTGSASLSWSSMVVIKTMISYNIYKFTSF